MLDVFYHVTHRRNVASILRDGLLCRKATGKRKAVWLSIDPTEALAEHIAHSHGWRADCLVVLAVFVRRDFVSVQHLPGVGLHRDTCFYSRRDIAPTYIQTINQEEVSL